MSNNNTIQLSSLLTIVYKFFIPTAYFILMFLTNLSAFVSFGFIEKNEVIIYDFVYLMFFYGIYLMAKLKKVSYNRNFTCISNFFSETKISNNDIVNVYCDAMNLYTIAYKEGNSTKRVFFMSHSREILSSIFFITPKSIVKFKNNIPLYIKLRKELKKK